MKAVEEKTKKEENGVKEGDKGVKSKKNVSKRKRKMMTRMTLFDLKLKSRRPDLVENWDITANDPLFLLEMKQIRNSVPVPRHWG